MTQTESPSARPRTQGWKRRLAVLFGALCIMSACVAIRYYWGAEPASAGPREAAQAPAAPAASKGAPQPAATPMKTVAVVNGEEVSREELAQECIRHYGKNDLEGLVNKYLIVLECQQRSVSVTQEEISAEIEHLAKRFGLPVDKWLKMLKDERGISEKQYATDIIWPLLAMRKLAGDQLAVSNEELLREFETLYGPSVKARLILVSDAKKAQQLREAAAAEPTKFGDIARQHSEDASSASLNGLIQPIRKNSGSPEIEQAAFTLKDGQVSPVIQIGNQFVILKREELIAARDVRLEQVQAQIKESVRERKMRDTASTLYQQLQEKWQPNIKNVLNDEQLSQQLPGVAAQINGNNVTVRELAERCIERHGEQVLDGVINRKLIEQAVKKKNITITNEDLDQEIARAAAAMLPLKNGQPDIAGWIELATKQQGITLEVYRRDSVWPSVALKKLIGEKVPVTDEDMQRGYEANYGPRVRCRAIILGSERQAQRVWEMARKDPKSFGDLAEKYSIEASSRSLKGQVPPIQKHGGQPLLEEAAFKLRKDELSQIIALDRDKYVILLCEGYTNPQRVEFESVKELIREDIHEKKLRMTMANFFQQLQDNATVDNFLAGTSRSPKQTEVKEASKAAQPGKAATR